MMKHVYLLLLICLGQSVGAGAQAFSPLGVWADDLGETHVEIYRCGEAICGQLVWVKPSPAAAPEASPAEPATDVHNPDPAKRSRPLQHLTTLKDLRYDADENRWIDGEIYDPSNGRTYSCLLTMPTKDRLEIKGYIGFALLGRSHTWTRLK